MGDHLVKLVFCLFIVMNFNHHHLQVHGAGYVDPRNIIGLSYLTNAVEKGAVCNDGSPATYHYSPGFGEGVSSWHVHLEGGGWCNNDTNCAERKTSNLGSSKYDLPTKQFKQMRTVNETENPDFYNWHRFVVLYCDSASFMGKTDHPGVILSRGARIFDAVVEELFQKGMTNATNAVLVGSSAGGLAAILHCDNFRGLFSSNVRVKCLSDSGFFIHAPKLPKAQERTEAYTKMVQYHGFADKLHPSCTSKMNASMCIFPEYMVKYVQTPLFLIESKFDEFQLGVYMYPNNDCLANLTLCTPDRIQAIKDFEVAFTRILQEVRSCTSVSMFVQPSMRHVHLIQSAGWNNSYKLKNKTIAQAVGDWFYDRVPLFQEIDADHDLPYVMPRNNSPKHLRRSKMCKPLELLSSSFRVLTRSKKYRR